MRGVNRVSQLSDVLARGEYVLGTRGMRPTLVAVLIAYKPYFRGLGGWGRRGFRSYQT